MPQGGFTTLQPAPAVQNAISAHQAAMNKSRYTPQMPEMFAQASKQNRVYVFNVGPWAHRRDFGSAGSYLVKPCPEGKEYSEPLVLDGMQPELYPFDELAFRYIEPMDTGLQRAQQVIGVGPHAANGSLVAFGVFLSETNPPKKEEVAAAKAALLKRYQELVHEANEAHAQGPTVAREIIQPDWHFVAARALKKNAAECPWLANTGTPEERAICPGCGDTYKIGIIRHGCGWIFDRQKWEENQGSAAKK